MKDYRNGGIGQSPEMNYIDEKAKRMKQPTHYCAAVCVEGATAFQLLSEALDEVPELDEGTQELNGYAQEWLKRVRKLLGREA